MSADPVGDPGSGGPSGTRETPHYVVCGGNPLTYRLVNELVESATGIRVTVIVPLQHRRNMPDFANSPAVRTVAADRLDVGTFERAGLAGAAALALVHGDDVANIHAALCAQAVEPDLRLVIRMFNAGLGGRVKDLFADCAVLSDAAMAAPAFVAAALGEPDPTHFRLAGRTMYVARRHAVPAQHVVCGLAESAVGGNPEILPADQQRAEIVLAEATGRPAGTEVAANRLARLRRRRRPVAAMTRALRALIDRKLGLALLTVFGVIMIAGGVQAAAMADAGQLSPWRAIYQTVLTTVTGSDVNLLGGGVVQLTQLVLTLAGLALIPLITAAVVEALVNARLAITAGRLTVPRKDHVVLVGLGNVGTRVLWQLHDLGVEVVAIDKNPDAPGAAVARRLGVPLMVADAAQEDTLRAAYVGNAQALVVVSTDDVTNLQAALNARATNDRLRVVLRLFDGDFANRIQAAFRITISRSVSYLAAPAFAAAMLEREVKATISVARHVLLVAEVTVLPDAPLVGKPLTAADRPGGVRVIGLTVAGSFHLNWAFPPGHPIAAGDRVTVVARRAGLRWLIGEASASPLPGGPGGP